MNFIDLIFALINDFSKMDPKKYTSLRHKADNWYYAVIDPENKDFKLEPGESAPPKAVATFLGKYGELWWVQILTAFAYPFLRVWLHGYIHPESEVNPADRLIG